MLVALVVTLAGAATVVGALGHGWLAVGLVALIGVIGMLEA